MALSYLWYSNAGLATLMVDHTLLTDIRILNPEALLMMKLWAVGMLVIGGLSIIHEGIQENSE